MRQNKNIKTGDQNRIEQKKRYIYIFLKNSGTAIAIQNG